MGYTFDYLEKVTTEIMNSNLSDETKKVLISVMKEKVFDQATEQSRIEKNLEFFNDGHQKQ